MAGRIRTIKPELLEDAKAGTLSDTGWRLFVSSFLLADDYGVLRAEPALLAGAVFWSRPAANIREAIVELIHSGLWTTYTVNDQKYAQINGWNKHQRVDRPNEKRRLPNIREADANDRESAAKDSGALATDHDHDHDHLRETTSPVAAPRARRTGVKQIRYKGDDVILGKIPWLEEGIG
ncbi:hypothetical protein LCGC14_2591720, partial [marine sediment metagenome]